MEYRRLGASGLMVPALAFGAGTFGGRGELFGAWGTTDVAEARRLVDICLDAGVTMFDTADVYSDGASEEVLGAALQGRRDRVLVSTKTSLPMGEHDAGGSSRSRLIAACEAALRRLGTDHIDLFQLHAFDAGTPVEEVLSTLDDLVRAGKVRYVGVSNFAGWQLMKSLAVAERHGLARYVAHQVYYSLVGRDYEWELMPLGLDQGVGAVVWSPLGWGRLTGRIRRGQPLPAASRLHRTASFGPPVADELLYDVVDALDERRGGDRPGGAAGRAELVAAQADRVVGAHRRPQRGAAAPEPRRGRLGADAGPGGPAGRGERDDRAVPVLPLPAPGSLRAAQPAGGLTTSGRHDRGMDIRVVACDIFGTTVDWYTGVAEQVAELLPAVDAGDFASRWRDRYLPSMNRVRERRARVGLSGHTAPRVTGRPVAGAGHLGRRRHPRPARPRVAPAAGVARLGRRASPASAPGTPPRHCPTAASRC